VEPKFHEDADKLKILVPFEECIHIKSSNAKVVKVPEYILLTHSGNNFNVLVDPTSLSEGVHYFEVYGHIERRFIEVPIGSTWVEATMRASGFDTPR
ncbi:hypothetical protein KI387_016128, partial [Taxus chinensis]